MKAEDLLPLEITAPEETDLQILAALDFEQAAHFLDLEDWIVSRLRHTTRELTVNLPLSRDDGTEAIVTGLRVQHYANAHLTLGPVHFSPDEDLHRLRASAMNLSWQMSLLELPFAGAAGAVICDPTHLSERELRLATGQYAAALQGAIGANSDVLSPGIGCNEQTMAWMLTAIARDTARHPRAMAAVVGKPSVLWGIAEHHAAAAAGLASLARLVGGKAQMAVSIQGFGPSARALAQALQPQQMQLQRLPGALSHADGVKLVGLADASGGLYDARGLDLGSINTHVRRQGVLFGYADAEQVSNADILERDCDVLVLDAAPQQISPANAERVRARMVVEAVNGAITRRAEESLAQRGAVTIPYLLASAGAAAAAALEWERNTHPVSAPFNLEEVHTYVAGLYQRTQSIAQHCQVDLRRAGMIAAVQRLAAQMRLRGRE